MKRRLIATGDGRDFLAWTIFLALLPLTFGSLFNAEFTLAFGIVHPFVMELTFVSAPLVLAF